MTEAVKSELESQSYVAALGASLVELDHWGLI